MKNMKRVAVATLVALSAISFCACQKPSTQPGNNIAVEQDATGGNGQKINEKDSYDTAAKQVPAEYKQVTTNENGVKIYGKIVDENTASEVGKKVIEGNKIGDKNASKDGIYYTYSEYYSETYGDTIILRTENTEGSRVYYNEKGQKLAAGSEASANVDVETILKNYRIGNAMADAMDKKIKGK